MNLLDRISAYNMSILPKRFLKVKHFLQSKEDISKTYPRLEGLKDILSDVEIKSIINYDKSRGYSEAECLANLPKELHQRYINVLFEELGGSHHRLGSIPHELRTEAICLAALKADPSNYIHIPHQVEESVYNEIKGKLSEKSSMEEWASVCSTYPCLICEDQVPKNVIENSTFWKNLDDFFKDYVALRYIPQVAQTLEICKKAIDANPQNIAYVREDDMRAILAPFSIKDYLQSDKDISYTYPYLVYLKSILTSEDIRNIINYDKSRGYSETECITKLPKGVYDTYVNSIPQHRAMELMEDYIKVRFQRKGDYDGTIYGSVGYFEFYPNKEIISPHSYLPENSLTVGDWHQLCSKTTELISEGIVPQEVINNPEFWNNCSDFLGKGKYLSDPDDPPFMDFDEFVFLHMPEALRSNIDIQMDLLSKGIISPKEMDASKLTKEMYLKFPSKYYDQIPQELRCTPEFEQKAKQAFLDDPYNIQSIPDKYKDDSMLEVVVKTDMELLSHLPLNLLNEEVLIEGLKKYRQQAVFGIDFRSGIETPAYINFEQDEHTQSLQYIPTELRTEAVCCAAMEANPCNLKYVPTPILQSLIEKIPDIFQGQPLDQEQKKMLLAGKTVQVNNIHSKDGNVFSGRLQYNAEKQKVELLSEGLNVTQIRNVVLQEREQQLLREGKTILVPGLVDEKGEQYNAWVRLDMKSRQIALQKDMPAHQLDTKKEIMPGNDFKIQVNQNTRGQKTEENKHTTEPLRHGQTQSEDKKKGMKL